MSVVKETQLHYLEYLRREDACRHHRYDEEMLQYDLLRLGDPRAMEESRRMWNSGTVCRISDDELRNRKYLFVASTTLACRFAILGGVEEQRAYDISDLYIQRVDRCARVEEISAIHTDMFTFYVQEVAAAQKQRVYAKPVVDAINFIRYHLHEKLTVQRVARQVGVSPNYLSALFKKELKESMAEYVLERRVEAAKNMLRFSQLPYDEIASVLAFSSQSHFIQVFKRFTGATPKGYRTLAYLSEKENEFTSSAAPLKMGEKA